MSSQVLDRVTLIDENGRLFFFEPPGLTVYELFDRNLDAPERIISKVSNCEWAFWAVTSDFEVVLYVYQRQFPLQAEISTYENQVYSISDKRKWIEATKRPAFSSEDGEVELNKEEFKLPSDHWRWQSGWYLAVKTSEDGWQYGSSFKGNFREKSFFYAFVRRRKWARKRTFCSYNTFIEIDSPLGLEFVNDVSVGGWLMPNQTRMGFLCVWIITNSGRLFFRENVSYENPEGSHWSEIKLPDNLTALSISCSQNGYSFISAQILSLRAEINTRRYLRTLWIVTCEEKVLLRTEIDCTRPSGNDWIVIEPHPEAVFVQVTANLNLVYALDMLSNVYLLNITEEYEWVKVLKNLGNISLSISNKLWAISEDKTQIFIGTKLHSIEDKFKFAWRCVHVPLRIDRLDASIAFDQLEDLDSLKLCSIK